MGTVDAAAPGSFASARRLVRCRDRGSHAGRARGDAGRAAPGARPVRSVALRGAVLPARSGLCPAPGPCQTRPRDAAGATLRLPGSSRTADRSPCADAVALASAGHGGRSVVAARSGPRGRRLRRRHAGGARFRAARGLAGIRPARPDCARSATSATCSWRRSRAGTRSGTWRSRRAATTTRCEHGLLPAVPDGMQPWPGR